MGDGVPNQGTFAHYEGGALVDYRLCYHDQQVTGDAWVQSLGVTPAVYSTLRAAALDGQQAFETALSSTAWHSFFGVYAASKTALRAGVLKLAP